MGSSKPMVAGGIAVALLYFLLGGNESSHKPTPFIEKPCASMGELRQKALDGVSANIVMDTFDAIKHNERVDAIGQKGMTLWMTGLSGSGKSTIGKALERKLVLEDGVHMYRLDGDNLRFGLSKDLRLGADDRKEQIRRAYEVSLMMADSGVLSLVSLISPFQKDRDHARKLHQEKGIPFLEVFVEASVEDVKARDPKGLYKAHAEGKIKGMTGLDASAPYDIPANPDILLKTHTCCGRSDHAAELDKCKADVNAGKGKLHDVCPASVLDDCINDCVAQLRDELLNKGLISPKKEPEVVQPKIEYVEKIVEKEVEKECPKAATSEVRAECMVPHDKEPGDAAGHADGYADGTAPQSLLHEDEDYWHSDEVTNLQPVPLTDNDVHWVQVIGEGWAAPLKGFMREGALVQALHFESVVFDTQDDREHNQGASGYGPGPKNTAFGDYHYHQTLLKNGVRVSMPIPIVLPISDHTKMLINRKIAAADGRQVQLVLVSPAGEPVAVLNDPEVFAFRKEEMIARSWGAWDLHHPYIKENIMEQGEWLLGGEFHRVRRVLYRDGLDKFRLTPAELLTKFQEKGADAVFAFQTRNPTHAGHAHLMKDGRKQLLERGFQNPVLWLSPLGGWTKSDDVPLDVRVGQHEAIIEEHMLEDDWTVMSIWPSPMVYSGPTEVQWHAKSRRVVGADYFIVGRDPAGLSYSDNHAEEFKQKKGEDVYHADHGRYVLQMSPGMGNMGLLASGAVHYEKASGTMKPKPDGMSKKEFGEKFLKISGSKMRAMGKKMVDLCDGVDSIPSNWAEDPSCVPPGFMVKKGWDIMKNYYAHKDEPEVIANAIVYSKQRPDIALLAESDYPTKVGLSDDKYAIYLKDAEGKRISPWHDVDLQPADGAEGEYNIVVEIPRGTNAKYEVMKDLENNPIKQDMKKGKARFYTYGMAFFNNGMFPQTWEDSAKKDDAGNLGDNDPLDVMEVGNTVRPIGSIVPVKILGALALVDDGETDYKLIALAKDDPDADRITDMESLAEVKGEALSKRIKDWLKMYKTTDKSDPDKASPNDFLGEGEYLSKKESIEIIAETHAQWKALRKTKKTTAKTENFWMGKKKKAKKEKEVEEEEKEKEEKEVVETATH
eukprot:TRINITY_DN6524_c2_g2_i1.p1 TRINITY_DN6524_c2_g2~~TRINITY_DN6524_c2_g2_i1.p1  ORF type:complete len:1118 (+),score=533.49 TRINITY_DN6524_c2_g2_i1:48-3401(+)